MNQVRCGGQRGPSGPGFCALQSEGDTEISTEIRTVVLARDLRPYERTEHEMRWHVGLLWLAVAVGCGESGRPQSGLPVGSAGVPTTWRPPQTAGGAGSSGAASETVGGAGGASGAAGDSGEVPAQGGQGPGGAAGGASVQPIGDAGSSSLAPIVTITSPAAIADPNDSSPLTEGVLEVLCVARASEAAGASGVDPSSLVVQLEDQAEVHQASTVSATGTPDEYTATFALGELYAPGSATITCAASDGADPPNMGRHSIPVFIDLGPTITIDSPAEGAAEPVNQALRFRYTIEPEPLTDDDPGSSVGEASVVIRGNTFALEADAEVENSYFVDVDFTDPVLFSESPTGELSVLVQASNSRAAPVTRTLQYTFTLDGTPPEIVVTEPQNGSVVGGFVPLRFTVNDDLSGVDASTIVVRLNTDSYQYQQAWGDGVPDYVFEFDSSQVSGSVMQMTVNISASDNAGNQGEFGTSHVLYLDNQPPLVSLDPPGIREVRYVAEGDECSHVFDPVGDNAVDDLEVLDATPRIYRAWVWERTNVIGEPQYVYPSMTNEESVFLYVQPDPNVPLLIDRDGDAQNLCDALSVESLDAIGNYVNLVPIPPEGSSFFGVGTLETPGLAPSMGTRCRYGTSTDHPNGLCDRNSDMFRVSGQSIGGRLEPVVFGIGPLGVVACTGTFWELAGLSPGRQGWLCLAARALDNVGNVGISVPLRVCYDNPEVAGAPDCSEAPPTCTDGCEIPNSLRFESLYPQGGDGLIIPN